MGIQADEQRGNRGQQRFRLMMSFLQVVGSDADDFFQVFQPGSRLPRQMAFFAQRC